MEKLKHKVWLRAAVLLNFILLTLPFVWSLYGYYIYGERVLLFRKGFYLVVALFVILYVAFGHTYNAFSVSYSRISEMVYSQGLALLFANCVMYIVLSLLSLRFVNGLPLLLSFAGELLLAGIWSFLTQRMYFSMFRASKTAVVYEEARDIEGLLMESGLNKKFDVVTTITASDCIGGKMSGLKEIETVFVCGVDSNNRNVILKYCVEHDIQVFVLPRIGDVIMSGAKRMHMFHLPFLYAERYNPPVEYLFFKRLFDVVLSFVTLVLISPVMLFTAIAIKLCDKGPVLYRQCRLTKDGKEFMILKFRSMRVDAEKVGGAQLSTGDADDRITPVGRFIRKVRIDELPQLINILRGDMSIVGPRPERPEIATQYEEQLPEFRLRLQAKAGLTGYAQVYGKYNTTPYDKLQMDLMYIANPNIIEDLRIIMATIKILFMKESTEGIAEGQKTAAVELAVTKEEEK